MLKAFLKTDLRVTIGLRRTPHYAMLQKATTPLLDATFRRLMVRRRRVGPAAADATGFETRHVSPYFLRRAGRASKRTRRHTRYIVLDIPTSCRDHLIPAACVGQGPGADVTNFPELIRQAARRVRVSRAAADAGYDSEEKHRLAREDHEIRTAIPPTRGRRSSNLPTGKSRRLMKQRSARRMYRQRWQVETVFSSVERRQGHAVHGRSCRARCRNPRLAVLTRNITLERRP